MSLPFKDSKSFDIRDHIDRLEPTRVKHKYECPVCGGHNLSVNPRTGAYKCYNGCESRDIIEAIAPSQDFKNDSEWQELKAKRQSERQREKENEKRRLANGLSIVERDQEIRKILDQLILSDDHRVYLEKRGVPPSIIANCRTVNKRQKLTNPISPKLPGVNRYGNGLTNGSNGILAPIDHLGNFVVFRLHDPINKDRKYTWLSSAGFNGYGPHLPNGELPVSVHIPQTITVPNRIGICEGLEWKAASGSERLGYPIIGISGNDFDGSIETITETINSLSPDEKPTITFIVDAGLADKRHAPILKNHCTSAKTFKDLGFKVEVCWYDQFTKSDGDIDEINQKTLDTIRYIPIEWVKSFCESERHWSDSKQLSNAITIHSERLDSIEFFVEGKGHGIKSGMGTGKTYSAMVESLLKHRDTGLFIGGYRNSLLYNICGTVEKIVKQINEINSSHPIVKTLHHIHNVPDASILSESDWLTGCFESFLRIVDGLDNEQIAYYFSGKHIFIDEVVSVISHLLTSKTLGYKRIEVIEKFKIALKACKAFSYTDANLCDWVVNLLGEWSGKTQQLTRNTYSKIKANIMVLEATIEGEKIRKNDHFPFLVEMISRKCYAVSSDSQIFIESIESWLVFNGVNPENILRVDSKTTPDKNIKVFLKDPDNYLRNHPNTILLYTTSAESGLDVSIENYFEWQYAFYFGIISIDSFTQKIGRIRDQSVNKSIWIRSYSIAGDDLVSGFTGEAIEYYTRQRIMLESNLFSSDYTEALAEAFNQIMNSLAVENKAANQLAAIKNYEKANLRRLTLKQLNDCGYQVDKVTLERTNEHHQVKADFKDIKEEVKNQNVTDIATATSEYIGKPLKNVPLDANWEDRCAQKKAYYFDRLPGFFGDEFENHDETIGNTYSMDKKALKLFEYEQRRLIPGMELLHLANNLDQAEVLALSKYSKLLEGVGILAVNFKTEYIKAKALAYLDINGLIESLLNGVLMRDSERVQELMEKASPTNRFRVKGEKRFNVQIALGKKPHKDPLRYVEYLANLVGFPTTLNQKEGYITVSLKKWGQIAEYKERLEMAIATRFDGMCTAIESGKVLELLRTEKVSQATSPQPLQDKPLSDEKNPIVFIKESSFFNQSLYSENPSHGTTKNDGVAPLPVAEPMEPAAPSPVEAITDFSVTPQIDSENDPFAVFKEGDRYGLWNQGLRKYVEATVKQVCHGLKGFVRLVTDDGFYGLCIELSTFQKEA